MIDEHRRVAELMPWYLNGSLDETDMNRVNGHLASCRECAQLLDEEMKMAQRLNQEPRMVAALSKEKERNFAKLEQGLLQSKRTTGRGLTSSRLAATLVCALLVGFFIGFGLFGGHGGLDNPYATLTSPQAGQGEILQVVFKPGTTEREMRTLLLDGGAGILSGPTAKGVYRLQLPRELDGGDYAQRLRQHPIIAFAEQEMR